MARRPLPNPFYALLIVSGTVFTITACAYGVMAFSAVQGTALDPEGNGTGLLAFLDRHGLTLLGAELALLAVATVGAIATDRSE